jgi:hypothetical protein
MSTGGSEPIPDPVPSITGEHKFRILRPEHFHELKQGDVVPAHRIARGPEDIAFHLQNGHIEPAE